MTGSIPCLNMKCRNVNGKRCSDYDNTRNEEGSNQEFALIYLHYNLMIGTIGME